MCSEGPAHLYPHLPVTGIASMHYHARVLYNDSGIELKSLHSQSKRLPAGALCPAALSSSGVGGLGPPSVNSHCWTTQIRYVSSFQQSCLVYVNTE